MTRLLSRFIRSGACAMALAAAAGQGVGAQAPAPRVVSLSVSKETAPPGGMAQMKVFITEPMPITTGTGSFAFSAYDSIEGIAVMNAAEDVSGIALVRGTDMAIAFTSPSGTYGLASDYPVLTVAGRIPADSVLGTKYPLIIDDTSLQLYDSAGARYAVESKPGHLITAPGLSIHDVNPGSAVVPRGAVVTISGSGFTPKTEIRFKEGKLSNVRYISPNRIDVVVAQQTEMHGMMIKASDPDSRCTYYSYQRTRAASASQDPVLRYAVPLTPPHAATAAMVSFPAPEAGLTYGIAVQNIDTTQATVSLELVDANGLTIASASVDVPSNRYVVRELSELFTFAPGTAASVRITSTVPVQVLGAEANQLTGSARAILPV